MTNSSLRTFNSMSPFMVLLAFCAPLQATANETRIENAIVVCAFDSARQTFSILHKPSKRTFIRDGRLRRGGGSATVGDVTHPVLGKGRVICVDVPSAEVVRMAVYPGLPFVVFDSTLRNPSKDPIDTHSLALFTAELVTAAGTSVIVSGPATEPLGGVNKTYQTFAAMLPFLQQHGAVGGWVTHNRGSGVIVTSAAEKTATLTPRLDFGNLRLGPGAETAGETFVLGWFDDARDGLEMYGDLIRRVYDIALPPRPPAGLCTWYMEKNGMLGVSEKAMLELLGAARKLKPFGFNATAAISDLSDAAYKDPEKTNIEVFRDGLKRVRAAIGPDTFLLGCNVHHSMRTLGGAFGLVDAMRIGPDTQAEMSLGASSGSRLWFLNGRVWWNDPDCVSIRPQRGSLDKARRDASWPAIAGQLFYLSDWLPDLPPERIEVLKRCMPSHGLTSARPLDVFQDWQPGIWRLTDTRYGVRRDVVGLFRWGGDKEYALTPAYLGLPKAPRYVGFDFWKNKFIPPFSDKLSIKVAVDSCAILAIRPAAAHPQLISTSRHVTQGIVDVSDEQWDAAAQTLSAVSAVVADDPYELRIVLPTPENWEPAGASVSDEDVNAGATWKMVADGTNLRVTLKFTANRSVKWRVRFETP